MRQGNNGRQRNRGRNNNRKSQGSNINRSLDSNGPNGRLRGNAAQLAEKYVSLARDARSNKDRVIVESLLQHAEHYQRMVNEASEAQAKAREKAEANRRENQPAEGEQHREKQRDDAPAATPAENVEAVEQPSVDMPIPNVEQTAVNAATDENPAPVRRQRRSGGQRRNGRAKAAAPEGAEASPAAEAPAPAAEAPAENAAPAEPSE
jgi:chemotaxis protein histidine kinase CheA